MKLKLIYVFSIHTFKEKTPLCCFKCFYLADESFYFFKTFSVEAFFWRSNKVWNYYAERRAVLEESLVMTELKLKATLFDLWLPAFSFWIIPYVLHSLMPLQYFRKKKAGCFCVKKDNVFISMLQACDYWWRQQFPKLYSRVKEVTSSRGCLFFHFGMNPWRLKSAGLVKEQSGNKWEALQRDWDFNVR